MTGDGLQRVRWSQLGAEFVRPGARFDAYDKVLLDPLTISVAPKAEKRRMQPMKVYAPTPPYVRGMQRAYRETFAKQFGRRGFSVVEEPGPGVLRISGHVVDLVLTARLDPEADPNQVDLVTSFGDLTLVLNVRDSLSGESLLRTVDRQPISRTPLLGGVRNTTGANLGAQRDVFTHEAVLLRQEILEFKQMGTVPAAPPPDDSAPSP